MAETPTEEKLKQILREAIEVSKRTGKHYEDLLRSLDSIEHPPDKSHPG